MTDTTDDDRRIDELFELAPDEFTAARNALARDLRQAGERSLAGSVGKLRRPTVAAWAVNQTVRAHRSLFETLLDAGEQVRRAQRRALSGVRDTGMRDAMRARRSQIEELARLAAEFLTARGIAADSHRSDIVATFDAASADEAAATTVKEARLSQVLPVSEGFGALEGLTVLADDDEGDAVAPARPEQPDGGAAHEQAAQLRRTAMRAVADARRRLTDAQATAARAEAEASRAAARAATADQTALVAEDTARRLRAEADELAARADRARSRSSETEREARNMDEELRVRERELQALDD